VNTRPREAARGELDRCHQRLAAAVARMPDAEIGDIAQMRLGGTERAAIAAAIATWEAAYRSAAVSEVQSLEANDRAAVTEREVARLSTAWEAFGTGNDAEAWFASPGSGGGERSGGLWWLSPVLVMVIAAVAVAVGQPIVGAGSAVVALIVGWLAVSGRRRAPLSGDQHAAMMEVAARLIAIKRQHADEVTAAERIADVCRRDLDHRERSRDDLVRHCSEFGLPIAATTPGIAASQIAAVDSIIDAHQQLSTVRSRLAGLETGHAAALEQVRLAGERVRTSADAAGVPTVAALETLDALLPDYGRAQAAWAALVAARRSERTAIDRFEQLIADLPEQVRGWRPERIAERAGELHTVNELRRDLDQDIAQITARIDARRAADEALGELLDRGHSEAELRTMVTEISEQITALSAASARISEEIGTLGGRLTELRRVDRLGALAVERGTLDERSDELAVEALVAVVTERILRSVAEEYERQHQPALISATERMARSVAPQWTAVLVRAAGDDHSEVVVSQRDQPPIPSAQLSTGARSLLYLALRIAMAEHDAEQRSVTVPLICDDPLVHLDDDRAESAFQLLRVASGSGRQVIVFTCHERTVRTARAAGAAIVEI
jgi:predicted component of type VI protein secretion system